ncbi:hypothetical protein TREMEDRAFT_58299 [Tremella mesenterica DSM 1558]|uniref:uncharacterized protein n=1 Tax=Tremella mesenterica (strain ATCC 24925 / CBS 8224 / DSM 1558 / NBRC 9311 / NRRL Y-6157 / RJB 2259-6 / UBC 559-6) TaxID=578456 RepID=UPI0003F4A2C9|nr:uncharacterized protein TREMEDRAFT_58299 [Tremella mesenterica DSM 1558]EIW72143.1 hypothetical protein TREMEDRAFT_58299 [Tremella mesenterica DSM 1558]
MPNPFDPKTDKSSVNPPKGYKLHPDHVHFQKYLQPQHPIWKNEKSLRSFQAEIGFYLQPWWHAEPKYLPQLAEKLGLREATPKQMKEEGIRAITRGSRCYSADESATKPNCHVQFCVSAFNYTHPEVKCVNVPDGRPVFLNRWDEGKFRVCVHCYNSTKPPLTCSLKGKPTNFLVEESSESEKRPKKSSQGQDKPEDSSDSDSDSSDSEHSPHPSPPKPRRPATTTRSTRASAPKKSVSPPPPEKGKGKGKEKAPPAASTAIGFSNAPLQQPVGPKDKRRTARGGTVAAGDAAKPGPKWVVRPSPKPLTEAPTSAREQPRSEGETELSSPAGPILVQDSSLGQDDGEEGPQPEPSTARNERPRFPPRPPKFADVVPEKEPSEIAPPVFSAGLPAGVSPILVRSSPVHPPVNKRALEDVEESQAEPKRARPFSIEQGPPQPEMDLTSEKVPTMSPVGPVPSPAVSVRQQAVPSALDPFIAQTQSVLGVTLQESPTIPSPHQAKSVTPAPFPSPSPAPKAGPPPNLQPGSSSLVSGPPQISPLPTSLHTFAEVKQWLQQKRLGRSGVQSLPGPNPSTNVPKPTMAPKPIVPPLFASQSAPPQTPPPTSLIRSHSEFVGSGPTALPGQIPSIPVTSVNVVSKLPQMNPPLQPEFRTQRPTVPSLDQPAPEKVVPYIPAPPSTMPEVEQCLHRMSEFQETQAQFEEQFSSRMVAQVSEMIDYYREINRGRHQAFSESVTQSLSGVRAINGTWSEFKARYDSVVSERDVAQGEVKTLDRLYKEQIDKNEERDHAVARVTAEKDAEIASIRKQLEETQEGLKTMSQRFASAMGDKEKEAQARQFAEQRCSDLARQMAEKENTELETLRARLSEAEAAKGVMQQQIDEALQFVQITAALQNETEMENVGLKELKAQLEGANEKLRADLQVDQEEWESANYTIRQLESELQEAKQEKARQQFRFDLRTSPAKPNEYSDRRRAHSLDLPSTKITARNSENTAPNPENDPSNSENVLSSGPTPHDAIPTIPTNADLHSSQD